MSSVNRPAGKDGASIWPVFLPVVPLGAARGGYLEALMRTNHPLGHPLLIHSAEADGSMWELDVAMLSCVRELMGMTDTGLKFGLNVSAVTVQDNPKPWLAHLKGLGDSGGQRLVVELTETAVHRNPKRTLAFVDACRDIGAAIAVDDYDANTFDDDLVYQVAPDYIKVGDAWEAGDVSAIGNRLRSSLDRIANLGVNDVVVEWIDSEARKTLAEAYGVRHLQGTYMAPHCDVDDVLSSFGWRRPGLRMANA
ncbi:EAL domain-containing protein [Pseudoxanthomonas kaohsiungensis]|uniref:EAL domain-containing protein n=1 Tax=Pseudoxanthomonas kaohsiungensis TaxID=283923 RepID=A0ABW3LY43_9GAMM|nr:EAL domain-containing protein [Pseudoxanthomonas kaohsiungensis]KAF1702940.1 hypothetical protein CSC66_09195 [Pseudoxanthomonas kaohsiungensis]